MRRFFKSAAFPILLVVILAFVASRVISSGSGTEAPSYNELTTPKTGLIAEGKVEEVDINTKDNTLDVKERNGDSFSTGYPPNTEQSLLTLLDQNEVKTDVHGSGGNGLLNLLTLILPFILFLALYGASKSSYLAGRQLSRSNAASDNPDGSHGREHGTEPV